MSRVGNLPISLPSGVNVTSQDRKIAVEGPLGKLELEYRPELQVEIANNTIVVKRNNDLGLAKPLHGLTRSLLTNMVLGVTKGWEKKLELVGVGYRASLNGDKLTLTIGYSHPVEIAAPSGIKFAVVDNTKVTVSGVDKQLVGKIAATIRAVRPPEPYQGKGIRYQGEYVRRKAGKAAKAATATK